jgi:hypothetical protein
MSELLILSRMARRVGVTQKWLRQEAEAGNIPCLKAGTRYLFNPVAVQEVLATKAANTLQRGGDDENESPPSRDRLLADAPTAPTILSSSARNDFDDLRASIEGCKRGGDAR